VLGALEERFRDAPVQVLGVHTAKFPAENETARVRDALARHDVRHPVVLDDDKRIWQSYAVRAWPTVTVVRPDGTVAASLPGEPDLEALVEIVCELLEEARRDGTLVETAPERPVEAPAGPAPPGVGLRYPGKIAATWDGLAVSDSGNHRVVLVGTNGRWAGTIGSGEPGLVDGAPGQARFRRPQGLALADEHLYVADAGNHAIRRIDLVSGGVETVAGDGELGRLMPRDLVPGREARLRSPWDLEIVDGVLFVAMAGFHQIWAYLPEEGRIGVFAGTGRESIDDGAPHAASFSQPSGLAADGRRLYVADAETSAVREIDLDAGRVSTLVGLGLFVSGDQDGTRETARLQHVEAVATGPHGPLVADTYNDKIRRLDPETGRVETWLDGRGGRLSAPGGLAQLASGQVLVADTDHHRVLLVDGATREAKPLPLTADETTSKGADR
jgi:DNA-binding beta-propeller fold protein YncE